jgi:dTDP-4-amino-4,6-dideoxygalactose transaminase
LHLQSAFSSLSYQKGDFPISEDCAQRIFSLPMHPYLTEEDQNKISDVIGNSDK